MRKESKPYFVAEISYNPSWPDMPWYIQRTGKVADQGGYNFGCENISFENLNDALDYLKIKIIEDLPEYERKIKEMESKAGTS